ncbi:MAG: hypothetical protein AAF544_13960 [Bacteroidota bacterium]
MSRIADGKANMMISINTIISYNTFVGGLALSVMLFLVVYGLSFW